MTAEIYCIACQIFIPDHVGDNIAIQGLGKQENRVINNAKKLRMRILPFLSDLGTFKSIMIYR